MVSCGVVVDASYAVRFFMFLTYIIRVLVIAYTLRRRRSCLIRKSGRTRRTIVVVFTPHIVSASARVFRCDASRRRLICGDIPISAAAAVCECGEMTDTRPIYDCRNIMHARTAARCDWGAPISDGQIRATRLKCGVQYARVVPGSETGPPEKSEANR